MLRLLPIDTAIAGANNDDGIDFGILVTEESKRVVAAMLEVAEEEDRLDTLFTFIPCC